MSRMLPAMKAERLKLERKRRVSEINRLGLDRLLDLIEECSSEKRDVEDKLEMGWTKTGEETSEAFIRRMEQDIIAARCEIKRRVRAKKPVRKKR